MLRQIEGSQAVAADGRAVPARGDLRLPDLAPDPHRRGPLGDREVGRARRRASTSTSSPSSRRCRSRSAPAPPARAPTPRPPARACCTWPRRSTTPPGSALPIVMTVANRAIGAPINIWNDHSDSMSQRDSGWIQLYAESNQEALDVHIQAFRLAEQLSLPVMVCMDGFILTHAVERVELPDAGAGRRVPARRSSRGRCSTPHDPMTIGAMVGPEAFTEVKYLAHYKQMQALDADPGDRRRVRAGVRPRLRAGCCAATARDDAETIVVALGSVLGTIEDVVDELREERRADRRASGSRPSGRGRWRRCATRSPHAQRVIVLEKALASGSAGSSRTNVRSRARGHRRTSSTPRSRASAGARSRKASLHAAVRRRAARASSARLTFVDLDRELVERELQRDAAPAAAPARTPRTCCATSASSPRDRCRTQRWRTSGSSSTRSGSFAVGNRLLDPEQRSVQADPRALERAHLRPPRLPGVRRGARRPLRARRRDARRPAAT